TGQTQRSLQICPACHHQRTCLRYPRMSLLPVEQALQQVLQHAAEEPALASERVALAEALGRVLAAPVIYAHDVPPWDKSAMDGHALHSSDLPQAPQQGLSVSQRITAGMAPPPLQSVT